MRTIIKPKCPNCGKDIIEISRVDWGETFLIESACGHSIIRSKMDTQEVWPTSRDGRQLFQFQKDGVNFLESADCNALLLDEQGLGKTVQECMVLNRNEGDLFPALGIVKSGLRAQWFAEIFRWTGHIPYIIDSSRDKPDLDHADIILISMDTLRLIRSDIDYPGDVLFEQMKATGILKGAKAKRDYYIPKWNDELCAKFKHIFVDECHLLKNDGSSRTKAFRAILRAGELEGRRARVIMMSGTAVEKHAGEFFVPLNAVRPEVFNNKTDFMRRHVYHSPETNKPGGLKDAAAWKELTSSFIIRRLRKDVLPDLPKIFRQFRLASLAGHELEIYKKQVKQYMKDWDDGKIKTPTDILGYLSHMRHVTGVGKTEACVEYIEEFLLESGDSEYEATTTDSKGNMASKMITAGRKLVVFMHHTMALDIVMKAATNLCKYGVRNPREVNGRIIEEESNMWGEPLLLNAAVPTLNRQKVVDKFKAPENRIMIASQLVAAEGLNMQFVSDALMMERQWNPSKEEQCEGRFPRPGAVADKINVVYLIAAGTIDDFFTKIVERKRMNVANTLDGGDMDWNQDSLLMELGEALRKNGLREWMF